ncbi:MAG: hypothetical protein MUC79_06070 [Thiobacillaceae bacterium]|jgi:hypothetical protein|nr:hypothetical protein [Thiobacillaceae bacterium]
MYIANEEYARRRGSSSTIAHTHGKSALEIHYPRICREITRLWFRPEINTYLESLIVDENFDRQGFPFEVFDELLLLSDLHWFMSHPGAVVEAEQVKSNDYTFAMSDLAMPHSLPWASSLR